MIRPARVDELKTIANICQEFQTEGKLPGELIPKVFEATWSTCIEKGVGRIFLIDHDDELVGFLGGLLYPDPNDGATVATEMFWFVRKQYRGKFGLRLMKEFEDWAIAEGAKRLMMVHLQTLNPEGLRKLYDRDGYKLIETHYLKEE